MIFGAENNERPNWFGIKTRKSWLFPKVDPFSFKTPITLNFEPLIEMVLSNGFMFLNKPFSKSEPSMQTKLLLLTSNELKFHPFATIKPLFGAKFSSTPTIVISGSVFSLPYFTSTLEAAVKDREVEVKGKLYLS